MAENSISGHQNHCSDSLWAPFPCAHTPVMPLSSSTPGVASTSPSAWAILSQPPSASHILLINFQFGLSCSPFQSFSIVWPCRIFSLTLFLSYEFLLTFSVAPEDKQNMPPSNSTTLAYYFELKVLEKHCAKRCSDSSLSFWKVNKSPMACNSSNTSRVDETYYNSYIGISVKKAIQTNLVTSSLIFYLKSNPFFLSILLHNFVSLSKKGIKSACFWFLASYLWDSCTYEINFSFINLSYVNLIIRPPQRT